MLGQTPTPEPVILPNCWYPIAASADLRRDRPLALERLGQRFVAWRDATGEPALLPAACRHRGADLALGRVRDGQIECPYHGFRFTGAGRCTAMPCEGSQAKIPPRMHTRAPSIREAHGLIWLWHGAGRDELPELPWIDGAPSPTRRTAEVQDIWPVSFTRLMEGMQDIHHLPFAHRRIDPFRRTRLDPSHTEVLELHDGVDRVRSRVTIRHEHESPEQGYSFELELGFPSVLRLGLGGSLVGTIVLAPIDERRTWLWACYAVQTGLGAWVDHVVSRLSLWFEFRFVQPDDLRMTSSSRPQACSVADHVLVRADEPIAAWHKLRRRRLDEAEGDACSVLAHASVPPPI